MKSAAIYSVKIASQEHEFEQIHRLNYETFVEEIPQHHPNPERRLVDKFHENNIYIICQKGRELIGMVTVRGRRPFSLDAKLANLDSYLPPARSICEIRLLTVRKEYRRTRVARDLLEAAGAYCKEHGYDLAVISGILNQQKLYRHMGFVPFGPVVGTTGAQYQPMYLTPENYAKARTAEVLPSCAEKTSLLPGPVEIAMHVRAAFARPPISHRSKEFMHLHRETKELLCSMVKACGVELFMGSGTMANDVVAGQIAQLDGRGLMLSNGEFGQRIIGQARRFGLEYKALQFEWGEPFDYAAITRTLDNAPATSWFWAVHCETSTGMLNDITALKDLCARRNIFLCLDCISSAGNVVVDLQGVYLASCVSGKGLGSFPGLSMVFYNHELAVPKKPLPVYLDLHYYNRNQGVPFTASSNLLLALHAALKNLDVEKKLDRNIRLSAWLKEELCSMGLELITVNGASAPGIITIQLPVGISSEQVADELEERGYLLSHRSGYLLTRNWLQICLMGEFTKDRLESMIACFKTVCSRFS